MIREEVNDDGIVKFVFKIRGQDHEVEVDVMEALIRIRTAIDNLEDDNALSRLNAVRSVMSDMNLPTLTATGIKNFDSRIQELAIDLAKKNDWVLEQPEPITEDAPC
jgi:hypothetical protein